MSTSDLLQPEALTMVPESVVQSANPIGKLAGFIEHADPGTRAALARLNPDDLRPNQIAALARALIYSGMSPETWRPATWRRWALIAHGMALAGHASKGRLGAQLAVAGVAESRVTKLLVSRGDAFLQIVPRLLRLVASKAVKPNWYDLSKLILNNDSKNNLEQEEAETLRLRIAGDYFSAVTRATKA
jgi:CRISPR system Cascade subunit CasB